MNKLKKVLLILFIFIIAILVIFTLNKSGILEKVADTIDVKASTTISSGSIIASSSHSNSSFYTGKTTVDGVTYYYVDDGFKFLASNWWVLCCEHGTAMRSVKLYFSTEACYSTNQVTPADAYLLAYMSQKNQGNTSGYPWGYRQSGQVAWWAAGSGEFVTADASTALETDVDENDADDYLSQKTFNIDYTTISKSAYLQLIVNAYEEETGENASESNLADYVNEKLNSITSYSSVSGSIWATLIVWQMGIDGYDIGNISEDTSSLYAMAYAFQEYIFDVLGIEGVDDLKYSEYTIDGTEVYGYKIDGIIEEGFQFEDLEVEVNFSQEEDSGSYDANSWIVGPFELGDYKYDEDFCYISDTTLILLDSEGSTIELDYDSGDFHFESTDENGLDTNGYPLPLCEFYVVFEYQSDLSAIEELSFELTYMNGAGSFSKYNTYEWYCSACGDWFGKYHVHCSFYPYCDYICEVEDSDLAESIENGAKNALADHEHKYCTLCETYDYEWDCWDASLSYEDNEANLIHEEHYYCSICEEWVELTEWGDVHKHCIRCLTGYDHNATKCTAQCGGELTSEYWTSESEYVLCVNGHSGGSHYDCPNCKTNLGSGSLYSGSSIPTCPTCRCRRSKP